MKLKRYILISIIIVMCMITFACSSSVNSLNKEALELIKVEDYSGALIILKEAILMDDENSTTWNNLSLCYDALGDYELAVDAALKSLESGKGGEIEYSNLGNAYFDLGNIEEAKKSYEKALEFNDDYFYALYGLGVYYTEVKNYNEALNYFFYLYDNKTFNVDVVRYITFCKYKQGELDQAISFLERELYSVNDDELEQLLDLLYDFKDASKN